MVTAYIVQMLRLRWNIIMCPECDLLIGDTDGMSWKQGLQFAQLFSMALAYCNVLCENLIGPVH